MACKIIIDGKEYTEEKFKTFLKSGLLYESLQRGLVSLPVDTTPIVKPEAAIKQFQKNFVTSKEDVVKAMKNVFGLNDKQAKAAAEVTDRIAKSWAARNNKTVEDYYRTITFIRPAANTLPESNNLLYSKEELSKLKKEAEQVKKDYKFKLYKAPNGKPTNLTEEQWLTVRTPTFKNWFGDWENGDGSKALDENGEPKVFYHGSDASWTVFDPEIAKAKSPFKLGALFVSPEIEFAEGYVKTKEGDITEFFVKANNPFDYENKEHLKILQDAGLDTASLEANLSSENWTLLEKPNYQKAITDAGFDSFYVKEMDIKNLAIYNPNQAKVSDGRNQTFLKESNDILFQQSPSQIINAVAKGFELVRSKEGFGIAFKSKNEKATVNLASKINLWLQQNNMSGVKFVYEKTYGTINAIPLAQPNLLFQSSEQLVRDVINYFDEPEFKKRNPNFDHDKYVNHISKFGFTTEIADELMPFMTDEKGQLLLFQQAQAAILLGQDGNDIIYALTNPNVSSPLHELAHKWERELTEQERNTVLDWYYTEVNPSDVPANERTWTREVSEAYARGFEAYLASGEAPVEALKEIFNLFKKWLTDIYKGIVGSEIDVPLNDGMKAIYAKMLGEDYVAKVTEEVNQEVVAQIEEQQKQEEVVEEQIEEVPPAHTEAVVEESPAAVEEVKQAYDVDYYTEAISNGSMTADEVENILNSAGLDGAKLVDKIMFRLSEPDKHYNVKAMLTMKPNAVFQQVANYFIENGSLEKVLDSKFIPTEQAKELLDKIVPDAENVEALNKIKAVIDERIKEAEAERIADENLFKAQQEQALKRRQELEEQELAKRNGFQIGDEIVYQGKKYTIVDELVDDNDNFKEFILSSPDTKINITASPNQFKSAENFVEEVKPVVQKVEEVKSSNFTAIPYSEISDKIIKKKYDAIYSIAEKFSKVFPALRIKLVYNNDVPGYIANGEVVINLKRAELDTPIHELLHPFIFVLEKENKKLFDKLFSEFKNTPAYNAYFDFVNDNPDYNILSKEDKDREAFIQYLGEKIAGLHDEDGRFISPERFVQLTAANKEKAEDELKELAEKGYVETVHPTTDPNSKWFGVSRFSETDQTTGKKVTQVYFQHPNYKITSNYFKTFYNWFISKIKEFFGITEKAGRGAGAKAKQLSEYDRIVYNPETEKLYFYKPAKSKTDTRTEKVLIEDEEGNEFEKTVKKVSRNNQASLTLSLNDLEKIKERGATEEQYSAIKEKIYSHLSDEKLTILTESLPASEKSEESTGKSFDYSNPENITTLKVSDLPVNMSINDFATMMAVSPRTLSFDMADHIDAITQMEAYQRATNSAVDILHKKIEQKLKVLGDMDRRIGVQSSQAVMGEYFAIRELQNKFKDLEFVEQYIRQGIGALSDANKIIRVVQDAVQKGDSTDEHYNQILNRDLKEAQALLLFYDDIPRLLQMYSNLFDESETDYFNAVLARTAARKNDIESTMIGLIADWLYPTVEKAQASLPAKDRMTKESFKLNVKQANKDVDFIGYWGQAVVNSKDPLTAALGVKVKEDLTKTYAEEASTLQTLRTLFDKFVKDTGIPNTIQAVEEYYKKNFLRKAKVWELVSIEKDGTKKYDYVERWAFNEEFYADKWFEDRRQEIERLKNLLGEPKNYEERERFNNKLSQWDAANPLQSAKYRNPQFERLRNNEYYMFLYDLYKKSNDKYGDRRLQFGIVPQAYEKKGTLDSIKDSAKELKEKATKKGTALEKVYNATTDLANWFFDRTTYEKVQSLNLDGTYYMSVKSPYTHLINEENLSLKLNETVFGFHSAANQYSVLRTNQANIENLKLLLNGNPKLGIKARQVLKTKIKTKDGKTSGDVVWDMIEGLPPQDKEQSAKRLTKQLNAFINDIFYGVAEVQEEFNVGPVKINVNKVGEKLGFMTALLNMAGNVLAGLSNVTIGNVMTLGEAIGGKYYSGKDWMNAQKEYNKALLGGKFLSDSIDPVKSKITQLGIMFDAIQGEFRDKYGKNITGNVLQRYFTKDSLFIINHMAEHQIQLTGMLALMYNTKVKLKNGEESNLYDAFVKNEKGFYKMREDAIWSETDQLNFIKKLHGVSRDLNGNYSSYDKSMLQRYALGKLVLQYRKYIYTAWRTRIGSNRFDFEKGTTQEGYYRAFFKNLIEDIKAYQFGALKRNLYDPIMNKSSMSQEQAYAARRTMFDMVLIATMTSLAGMLAHMEAGEDDEDDKYWENIALLWALRLRSDVSQFSMIPAFPGLKYENGDVKLGLIESSSVIQELYRMGTNPSASFNTAKRIGEFLTQLYQDTVNQEFETYQRATGTNEAGDLKVVSKFEKLVPLWRQWLRLQTPEDQVKYYDLINKNVKAD